MVTNLKAGVLATVQQGSARFLTAQQRCLAAAHRLTAKKPTVSELSPVDNPTDMIKCSVPDLSTDTRLCYKGRTLWTRSRMAQTEEACKKNIV